MIFLLQKSKSKMSGNVFAFPKLQLNFENDKVERVPGIPGRIPDIVFNSMAGRIFEYFEV